MFIELHVYRIAASWESFLSDGKSMAVAYTLTETGKVNGVGPQAWLTDVTNRIAVCAR